MMGRREPMSLDRLIAECIRDLRLESGLNDMLVFGAWDKASGAAEYTADRYFHKGTLYCRISSSVVRSMLSVRRRQLLRDINEILKNGDGGLSGQGKTPEVKNLILK